MTKVLFIISNLNPQGPIKQLFYLCKYLNRQVIKTFIVTTSQQDFNKSMHREFDDIGVQIIDLKLIKLKSVLQAKKEIQGIIYEKGIDIIQSFGFRSDIISHDLKKVFRITSVRYTMIYNYKMIYGSILGFILGHINLYYIRKFESVIACSYSVHNYLKTLKLNSEVIVNSINPDEISGKQDKSEVQKLREKLNLPENAKIFTTVSSKLKGKNIEFLINSFLKKELQGYILIIAGYVETAIIDKYKFKKNIHFIGIVSNLTDYLSATDFFISASLHEGMPNAVLEAMAKGTPVVLSDIPPHNEVIDCTNLEVGKIFKNNDYEALMNTIQEIISIEYSILSENCIITISEKFNAKKMAKQYEDLYLNIITT